ncbi:isocitrate lyase/PEP mutase family protein [Paracraurococcus ruber]|uniref:Carboxyvinyl-carboxyphosphonate phosphorylmutase n=1 Tax=Paracraurococcus ruber TaxID=77675 RepID=A0ABS1D6X9_9PROT|nr:isocitrate lyase/PEP mutase family protein [Paracraurococcus ruber]MBK1662652.1 carboxyvinyl-carboxyphosphonate phosphorylmutase [Paracraurococcus ruber]TDG21642.1 isocitrate lyase/PEP mutase family protein [Paracraurococcus ruber]
MRLGQGGTAGPGTRLRAMLATRRPLVLPGCYNALTARILESAGHEALYMTGYGTSLSLLGLPDAGLITLTEMALNARLIASAVRAPVIADADTGFGNAVNMVRTVEEYIRAGLAGMHVEDQVAPKRCGHVAGREVIGREEAVGKIRAADATRRNLDPDFLLIARTDARGAHGGSLDEAIARANLFLEAGADLAFVEGPASKAEIGEICRRVNGPVLYNQTGISPRLGEAEMAELGIAITILPGAVLRQTIMAVHDLAVALKEQGALAEAEVDARTKTHPRGNVHLFAGFDRIRALEAEFMPAESQEKYQGTLGHMPEAKG